MNCICRFSGAGNYSGEHGETKRAPKVGSVAFTELANYLLAILLLTTHGQNTVLTHLC